MRRSFFILFIAIFLFGIVSSGSSDVDVTFTIGGCSYTPSGSEVEEGLPSDSCSEDGKFFCDVDGTLWSTLVLGKGCSLGKDQYLGGGSSCCPTTHACVEIESENFVCVERTESCDTYTMQTDCFAEDCVWVEDSLTCISSVKDLSCDFYNNSIDCAADSLNLGNLGIGTDVFGDLECGDEAFSVSEENSSCMWNAFESQCYLNYVAEQTFSATDPKTFSCSNVYSLGDCINGEQNVEWTSDISATNFPGDILPAECLEKLGCINGSTTRFCGESAIKLPGFSLFSLFSSLMVIGIFYFFSKK